MEEQRSESSEARADVNRNVRLAVERLDVAGLDGETWNFLCECGSDGCENG